MGTVESKLPLIVIVAPLKLYGEETNGVRDSKYVVVSDPVLLGHVIRCMRTAQ